MTPLHLRQSGEYDADFEVSVAADGRFWVEGGGYVTRGRREGRLSRRERRAVDRLTGAVVQRGALGAEAAFRTVLQIDGAEVAWSGPPPTEPLRALAGALARLG